MRTSSFQQPHATTWFCWCQELNNTKLSSTSFLPWLVLTTLMRRPPSEMIPSWLAVHRGASPTAEMLADLSTLGGARRHVSPQVPGLAMAAPRRGQGTDAAHRHPWQSDLGCTCPWNGKSAFSTLYITVLITPGEHQKPPPAWGSLRRALDGDQAPPDPPRMLQGPSLIRPC